MRKTGFPFVSVGNSKTLNSFKRLIRASVHVDGSVAQHLHPCWKAHSCTGVAGMIKWVLLSMLNPSTHLLLLLLLLHQQSQVQALQRGMSHLALSQIKRRMDTPTDGV